MTAGRQEMTESQRLWPAWASQALLAVLTDAEEEARERGDREVQPVHLALAIVRQPSTLWDLLRSLGVEPRRWRDYINQVIGVNIGLRRARSRDWDVGSSADGPAALRYAGPLHLAPTTSACLDRAYDLVGASAAPEHVLLSVLGTGDIAAGTARWMGLTERPLREVLALPAEAGNYRRGPGNGPRPQKMGPLVLMGSCHPNPDILRAALRTARNAEQSVVAAIFAAGGCADDGILRAFSDLGARVVDPGIHTREGAERESAAAHVRDADVVFIGGGNCKVLCDALVGTPVLDALVSASDSGAVVVGCSAGISLLSVGVTERWSAPGDPAGPFPMLAWLGAVAIEPHLSPGRGVERLREAMRAFPGSRGLGVAHMGAVVIESGWQRARTIETGWEPGNLLIDTADAEPRPLGSEWLTIA